MALILKWGKLLKTQGILSPEHGHLE